MPDDPASRRALRVLLAITVVLILYASFYPFSFDFGRMLHSRQGIFPGRLQWDLGNVADTLANLLFYIPLGLLLVEVWRDRWRSLPWVAFAAIAAGTLLSLCVEVLQQATLDRVPSFSDVALNATSTAIGVVLAVIYRGIALRPILWLRDGVPKPAPLALLALWVSVHAAPFMPSIGIYKTLLRLQSLRSLAWSLGEFAYFLATYLIVSVALRAELKRRAFWPGFFSLIVGSLVSRLIFSGQHLSLDECAAAALCLPIVALLRSRPHQHAARPIAWLVVVAIVAYELAPFEFSATATHFNWVPFAGVLEADRDSGFISICRKALLYGGAVWLWALAGERLWRAAGALAALVLLLELAQTHLPGRYADITEPLLVLCCALVIRVAGVSRPVPRRRERAHSRSQPRDA